MTKENCKPSIRFAGFNDAWEQRKLGELVERVVRKNKNNESTLPLTISAQYGLVDQITYFNNRVASRDISNYYLVLNGEFAYNKSTSDGYPFGTVKRLDLYEKGVISTLYIVFVPKKEVQINSDFLTVFFDTDRWHKGVAERAAEGARNHGLLNISAEDFFDIDISVSKDVAEQKQIGIFLKQLDNLITLHQRKYDKLTTVKKSMLEKMFPKNGCNVPEIRFKGFTDAWEQRKLSELVMYRSSSLTVTDAKENGKYYLYDANSIIGNTDIEPIRTKYITIIKDGAGVGRIRKMPENTMFIGTMGALIADRSELNFIFALLTRFDLGKTFSGSTIPHIYFKDYGNNEYLIPNQIEQEVIGDFFHKLDNLITLHQRKLEKLKNIKKACLEKMFV